MEEVQQVVSMSFSLYGGFYSVAESAVWLVHTEEGSSCGIVQVLYGEELGRGPRLLSRRI